MSTLHADQPSCTPTVPPASEERRSRAAAIAPCLRCGAAASLHSPMTHLVEVRGVTVVCVTCDACVEYVGPPPGEREAQLAYWEAVFERQRTTRRLMEAHWDDRVLPAMRAMLAAAEVA